MTNIRRRFRIWRVRRRLDRLEGRTYTMPVFPEGYDSTVAVPAHALDGSDGRFGIGKGRYDHFKPDPKRVGCTPIHDRLGDEWVRAEGTKWQGRSFDLVGGGSRVVGPDAMVSVGGTTYAIWPCAHGVGTS